MPTAPSCGGRAEGRWYLLALSGEFGGQVGTDTIQDRLNELGGLKRTEHC